MTPPDSGSHALCADPDCDLCAANRAIKPDSSERAARYCQHGCQHRATSCDVCPACAHFVADQRARAVPVPLDLAQRTLAALVHVGNGVVLERAGAIALAAELRACAEGKS